jgi:hypothetical protein
MDVLEANSLTGVEAVGLVLFFGLLPGSPALWTAIAGFVIRLVGRDPAAIDIAGWPDGPAYAHRGRDGGLQRGSAARGCGAGRDLVVAGG